MDLNKQYIQRKIQIRKAVSSVPSLSDSLTAQPNLQQKMMSAWSPNKPSSSVFDYFLPIMISRTSEVYEYVDVKKDEKTIKIDRQEINPYFIELGIFDDLSRIKSNVGSDLTYKMMNFIIDKIGNVKVLKEYPLEYIEVLIYPSSEINFGLTGIMIGVNAREDSRPGTSKLILEGTPYDGTYQIKSDWIDNSEKIGGFFCEGQRLLNIDSTIEAEGALVWARYRNTDAKIKLVETIFDSGSWEDIKKWFNRVGYNQFAVEEDTVTKDNILDTLDKLEIVWTNLISKANYFKIDINK